jgi:hypothetical protein
MFSNRRRDRVKILGWKLGGHSEGSSFAGSARAPVRTAHWQAVSRRGTGQGLDARAATADAFALQPRRRARDRATAANAPSQRCAVKPARRSAPLPARTVAQACAVPGQRRLAAGLQPGGERDPALRRRKTQLAVRYTIGGANATATPYSLIETAAANNITTSSPTATSSRCSRSCRWRRPSMTSRRCCSATSSSARRRPPCAHRFRHHAQGVVY